MFNRLLAISFWLLAENKQATGSFKLEAGSLKQNIIRYQASIRFVAIGFWLLAENKQAAGMESPCEAFFQSKAWEKVAVRSTDG